MDAAQAVRTTLPLPTDDLVAYFEVTVEDAGAKPYVRHYFFFQIHN